MARWQDDLIGLFGELAWQARHTAGALGRAIEYVQLPMAEIRKNSEDFALMLEWFERVGYNADIPALEREFGVTSTGFGAWAKRWAAAQQTA